MYTRGIRRGGNDKTASYSVSFPTAFSPYIERHEVGQATLEPTANAGEFIIKLLPNTAAKRRTHTPPVPDWANE